MSNNKQHVLQLMRSVHQKYFPDVGDVEFAIEKQDSEGICGRLIYGEPAKVTLYYSEDRLLEQRYRMGLVPLIAHELAHLIDPVDPDRLLRERLPPEMVKLWLELIESGEAECSMRRRR